MRRLLLLTFAALCAFALLNGSMAEDANSDWYAKILDDRNIIGAYPYYAILDVNGDDVPVLIVSSTEDSFIGLEDRARVYTCFEGKPTMVMEVGGGGGDTFFSCWDEHTLTRHYRLSGEAHMEVYRVVDGTLEMVTQADAYQPGHYGIFANTETVHLQDGAEITAKQYEALGARYANEEDIVTYEGETDYAPDDEDDDEDDDREEKASVSIEWVQKRLRALGYTAAPVDGVYGSRLKSAVKRFQREVGLKADGIIGDKTIRALQKKNAPYCSDYIELKKGDSGDRVRELQEKLRELGFLKGSVDGSYGRKTVDAVAWFKSHFDLDGSGRSVDAETVRMIMETDLEDVERLDEDDYEEEEYDDENDHDEEEYDDENDHDEEEYDDENDHDEDEDDDENDQDEEDYDDDNLDDGDDGDDYDDGNDDYDDGYDGDDDVGAVG